MERNAMTYSDRPEPQHDLARDQIRPVSLKRAEDHAVNQQAIAAAVLRPMPVHRLVTLLRSLPVRERTTILARAIHEGTLTRVGADQVLFAIAFDSNTVTRAALLLVPDDKRSATPAPSLTSR